MRWLTAPKERWKSHLRENSGDFKDEEKPTRESLLGERGFGSGNSKDEGSRQSSGLESSSKNSLLQMELCEWRESGVMAGEVDGQNHVGLARIRLSSKTSGKLLRGFNRWGHRRAPGPQQLRRHWPSSVESVDKFTWWESSKRVKEIVLNYFLFGDPEPNLLF